MLARLANSVPTLPRLGIIRKGAPKTEKAPGKDLDYFRVTSEDPAIFEAWKQAYGDDPRPKKIAGVLPFHRLEDNWIVHREHWASGKLVHRCDGEWCSLVYDQKTNRIKECQPGELACPDKAKDNRDRRCKEKGDLLLMLPVIGRLGYFAIRTTSWWDITTITEELMALQQFVFEATGNDSLRAVPIVVARYAQDITVPMGDSRGTKVSYLLHVELDPTFGDRVMRVIEHKTMPALPAPDDDDDDSNLIIDGN